MDWQLLPIFTFIAVCLYTTALIIRDRDNE